MVAEDGGAGQVGKDGTLLKVTEAPGMEGTTASYKRFMQKVCCAEDAAGPALLAMRSTPSLASRTGPARQEQCATMPDSRLPLLMLYNGEAASARAKADWAVWPLFYLHLPKTDDVHYGRPVAATAWHV